MEIVPQELVGLLREQLKDEFKGPGECQRILSVLNYNITEEQLDSAAIDIHLIYIFENNNGLFEFIFESLQYEHFSDAVSKSLQIIYTLINNLSSKTEEYIFDINLKCVKIVQSQAKSSIKIKALDVLTISFEKIDKCLDNPGKYLEVFESIKNVLLQGTHADTVRQKEFIVLGLFAKKFSYVVENSKFLKKLYVGELKKIMSANKGVSQSLLHGVFQGLTYLNETFPFSVETTEEEEYIQTIYQFIKKLSVITKGQRHFGSRAAMIYFGKFMDLFIKTILVEYKQWHKRLLKDWMTLGLEDKKIGQKTLDALLLAVSKAINELNSNDSIPILNHFIGWFKSVLKNSNASYEEKKLCVRGLTYFTKPMYLLYNKGDLKSVNIIIMQNFELSFTSSLDNENFSSNDDWDILPDYIQCLSGFMRYQKFTISEIYCLQRSVINLFKTFDKLKTLQHSLVIDSIVITLFHLKGTEYFDNFLENIIYQGVLWSCSHQHISDSNLAIENVVTVKNYFPLWRNLLRLHLNYTYDKYSIYLNDRRFILVKIISELIKTLLILINKLNVNVKMKEDVIQTDIESAYEVENLPDYTIFLNLIDFYQHIFICIEAELLSDCICRLINHLIGKCIKFSLNSGFYRLLSFTLKISNKLKIFNKENVTLNQDIINCKESFAKFLIILIQKMKFFKDELLISCVYVLLESPVMIIEPILHECINIFRTIFEIGRSYIDLANMGLDTLEHWQKNMNKTIFEPFLIEIISSLDHYLRSKSLGGISQTDSMGKKRKTVQMLKKRAVIVQLEPELVKFQKRVLQFVGKQNNTICKAFVSLDSNFERKIISDNLQLKVSLPYKDQTLDIYLEPLIIRVMELCIHSTDRNTRVISCELFHAMSLVFLGRTKKLTSSEIIDSTDLFNYIINTLMLLACDIDNIVKNMFEPLFMQIIHWYTSKKQQESPHLAVLIESLMDGITDQSNTFLRDFSGKCLNEFLKWTIKQNSQKRLKENPINFKALVRKIIYFSRHPDSFKKMGAALIFNNIYQLYREEDDLVNAFTVELLHTYISSLDIIESHNEECQNAVTQIINAVMHIKRIILEKSELFIKPNQYQRFPSEIAEGNFQELNKWLLLMTGSGNKDCRNISMNLLQSFQEISGKNESLYKFINRIKSNFLDLYNVQLETYSIFNCTNIPDDEYPIRLIKWLNGLQCQIDGFIYIINNDLFKKTDQISLDMIMFFVHSISEAKIEKVFTLMTPSYSNIPQYTVTIKEQFNKLRVQCSIGILNLLIAMLSNVQMMNYDKDTFWNGILWKFITMALFNSKLLLDSANEDEILINLLEKVHSEKLSEEKLNEFVNYVKKFVSGNFNSIIDLRTSVNLKQRSVLKGLLLIEKTEFDQIFHTEEFSEGIVENLLNSFMKYAEENVIYMYKLSDVIIEHCNLMLRFALKNPTEYSKLIKSFYQEVYVTHTEMGEFIKQIEFGLYVIMNFTDGIMSYILEGIEEFLEIDEKVKEQVSMLNFIMKHLEKNKHLYSTSLETICEPIAKKWIKFQEYFDTTSIDLGLEFVRQFYKTFGSNLNDYREISYWVVDLICKDEILLTQFEENNLYLNIFNVMSEILVDDTTNLTFALDKLQVCLKDNTNMYEKYINNNFSSIKNSTILTFLLNCFLNLTSSSTSSMEFNLADQIKIFMHKNSNSDDNNIQLNYLKTVYNMATNVERNFQEKKYLCNNIIACFFKHCTFAVFEQFFTENIKKIISELSKVSGENLGNCLIHFLLLELLVLRIPLNRPNCAISAASGHPKLLKIFMELSLNAFKYIPMEEVNDNELRLYKCAAYKALASVTCNSIKIPQFYEKLFIREENNEDILWSALIDRNIVFQFDENFDNYPKKRKILLNIKKSLNEDNKITKSLKYLESQRLFNSSLSEDVTKFDFTTSVVRSEANNAEEQEETENFAKENELYLEGTEVNNMELMDVVCGIIEHVFSTGIFTLPQNDDDEDFKPPKWIMGISSLIKNRNTHPNIKIFWIKVIDNMIHIFRYFSEHFVEPLLTFLNEKVAGDNLNYFVTDIIVILSSWSKNVKLTSPETEELASNFLNHIIKKLENDRREVFKYNMDLLKIIIENWNEFIQVPYETIISKLNIAINDRQIEVGIHVTSIFLVNNQLPCEERKLNEFWNRLIQILESKVSTIYKPCAETIGILMKFYESVDQNLVENLFVSNLRKLLSKYDDLDKCSNILEGISIHYPKLIDEFLLTKLLNRLPQSNPNLQKTLLKIICQSVHISGSCSEFKNEDWMRYLESQHPEVQLITLEIILKNINTIKELAKFRDILKSVTNHLSNRNILCRGRMYDILITIMKLMDQHEYVKGICREALVEGLIDADNNIREKIRNFWSEECLTDENASIYVKFPFFMLNFYLPKIEQNFLGYISYYTIDCLDVEHLDDLINEHALEDCDFEEYKLPINWRLQHPSVVPMFAQTLNSLADNNDETADSFEIEELRATQENLNFAPTQQETYEKHISQITSLDSSLFGISAASSSQGAEFLNPNNLNISQRYKLPKRRFLKDEAKIAKDYMNKAITEKIQKVSRRYDAIKEHERKVTIYRKYRKGDFPDVQIPISSIIKPLQMLLLNDGELAKQFFLLMFKTLKESVKKNLLEFSTKISEAIKHIIQNTVEYNVNVFSTLLIILLTSKSDFRIEPESISTICVESGLTSIGALLIEEYLMDLDVEPTRAKKSSNSVDEDTMHWIKLAELYKNLHEWDLVKTIFLNKCNSNEETHKAIQFESEKKWREAQETYQQLLTDDISIEKRDFYYESCFKCLAHLGEWNQVDKLVKNVLPDVKNQSLWTALWDNDWYQQKILPWYINANVKDILFTGNDDRKIFVEINESLCNREQTQYLKNKFSEELCILWLTQKDVNQAGQYLNNGIEIFLNDWQLIHPMFGSLRYNKILNLQSLIEIKSFMDILKVFNENDVKEVQEYWKSTQNEYLPSIILSEAKLLYRNLFARFINDKFKELEKLDLVVEVEKNLKDLNVAFMKSAIKEGNFYMTRKYFKTTEKSNKLTMIYGNLMYLYSSLVKHDSNLQTQNLLKSLNTLSSIDHNNPLEKLECSLQIVEISEELKTVLVNNPEMFKFCEETLKKLYGDNSVDPLEAACSNLRIEMLNLNTTGCQEMINLKTKSLIKLAYLYRNQESNENESQFIFYVLNAMKLGSKEARQLFPCILQLDSISEEIFEQEIATVPTWMFLRWIPQLLALIDSPKVMAIAKVIERIAETYPKAILYSYRLNRETYLNSSESSCVNQRKNLLEKLDSLLYDDKRIDEFLDAMARINVPAVSLIYYLKKIQVAQTLPEVLDHKDKIVNFFFKDSNFEYKLYKDLKPIKNDLLKITNRLKLDKIKSIVQDADRKCKSVLENAATKKRASASVFSTQLKDYSKYLANFSATKLNFELEIPGQYSGDNLPLIHHHVKLAGFRQEVTVLSSLRKPIKVTMLGMNGKEYPFLVKFGEDIRQDQRIEQIFELMNNIFINDNKFSHILTYQVIPLSKSLGLIQWVENTISFDEFIQKAVPANAFNSLNKKYEKFWPKALNNAELNFSTLLKNNRDKMIPLFNSWVNQFPLDALKKAFWSISLTTETFIALKENFIKSYATLCICHWILGVGDRHLQNFKICSKTGKVLGIDFGHAFGTATQILPIPEIVPIRLTPHIIDILEPLREKGILRNVMISCLKSLREEWASLKATMEVFLLEPSIDWLEQAKLQNFEDTTECEDHLWYPSRKLDQAVRKLKGASSVQIMIEDLNMSRHLNLHPKHLTSYIALISGDEQFNFRAQIPKKDQYYSVENQVDILIDHATDYNLLGRMYYGWNPAV